MDQKFQTVSELLQIIIRLGRSPTLEPVMRYVVEDLECRYFEDTGRLSSSIAQSDAGLELSLIGVSA
jgi:hypothetical protein